MSSEAQLHSALNSHASWEGIKGAGTLDPSTLVYTSGFPTYTAGPGLPAVVGTEIKYPQCQLYFEAGMGFMSKLFSILLVCLFLSVLCTELLQHLG